MCKKEEVLLNEKIKELKGRGDEVRISNLENNSNIKITGAILVNGNQKEEVEDLIKKSSQ